MCGPNFCAAKLTHDLRKFKVKKMFSDELKNISWEDHGRIARMTDNDVRVPLPGPLRCERLHGADFTCSRAIPGGNGASFPQIYRGALRQTMSMFIPLYITNSCSNSPACIAVSIVRIRWPVPSSPQSRLRTQYKAIKRLAHSRTSFSLRARTSQGWHPISCQGNRHRQEVFL